MELSKEQQKFIDLALVGNNILVDACIGSGKTTSIQQLCNCLPSDKKILYLTYNKLLKLDAKQKIKMKNVLVQNYDGFAFWRLKATGNIIPNQSNCVSVFNNILPKIPIYDILIIDEYQDIKEEHSIMLEYIKSMNSNMQIIAVGDMEQKIYDMTTLDVNTFIKDFLNDYIPMEFTQCFRLCNDLASKLGRIWNKKIIGVNDSCNVIEMNNDEIIDYLYTHKIEDILCLGSRQGLMPRTLNKLEAKYPEKFNKNTVYASIRDSDNCVTPDKKCAIFTTFDSSKGLERNVCVVFDFTKEYWFLRLESPHAKYEILRNIFCVAASRGKNEIIFVKDKKTNMLDEHTLSKKYCEKSKLNNMGISSMFDFKYEEDIEECYNLLEIEKVNDIEDEIDIPNHDGYIDLSPCIGIYQEAQFFNNYNIDNQIQTTIDANPTRTLYINPFWSLEKKILALTSFETCQKRYLHQVSTPFITTEQSKLIIDRLSTILSPDSKEIQCECNIIFNENNDRLNGFCAMGRCDVIHNNDVYELKFVSSLAHEHFLQCACYMIALHIENGYLWNIKTNERYKINIPNKKEFLDCVAKTITKRRYTKFYGDY